MLWLSIDLAPTCTGFVVVANCNYELYVVELVRTFFDDLELEDIEEVVEVEDAGLYPAFTGRRANRSCRTWRRQ